MSKIKGCSNDSCEAHNKNIKYNVAETFCSKCGSPLVYVCKACYTQLPDNAKKYCMRCLAKHDDRKNKSKQVILKAGGAALGVSGIIFTSGKKAFGIVKKIRG